MQVREIMTSNPACCTIDTSLQEVAQLMVEYDCGEIPVVENQQNLRPVGVVTDRDITIRTVARGENPLELTAGDIMSRPVATVRPTDTLEECIRVMEDNQVRRVPVCDDDGRLIGIIAQADICREAPEHEVAEVVREVSQPI